MHRFLPIGILLSLTTLASLEPLSSQTIDSLAFKDLQFRMAGPFRGGRSSAVTGFPADLDRWLMGTTGGGVWRLRITEYLGTISRMAFSADR